MRLYQVAGSTTSRFAYDGTDILADYDGSSALQHRYVFGPGVDEPIVEYSSTGVRTYLSSDERGSIVARTDGSGNLVNANTYDEYGIPGSSNAGLFQYTGQAWIGQIGMYNYKARIYSPTLGRFMQTDPIGPADSPNLYQYVHNDPVNLVDPTGLACPYGEVETAPGSVTFDPNDPNGPVTITPPVCTPLSLFKSQDQIDSGGTFGPLIGIPDLPTFPIELPQQKPTKLQCAEQAAEENALSIVVDVAALIPGEGDVKGAVDATGDVIALVDSAFEGDNPGLALAGAGGAVDGAGIARNAGALSKDVAEFIPIAQDVVAGLSLLRDFGRVRNSFNKCESGK